MTPDIEDLFEQAVSLSGTEREEFLVQHCADTKVREELRNLLAHDQGAETFLKGAVAEEASTILQNPVLPSGKRLGPYRILSMIGRVA
jgi:hypothetical protein